jgi:ankyrin repeat protein
MHAVSVNNVAAVKMLLARGVDREAVDEKAFTARAYAMKGKRVEIQRLLEAARPGRERRPI